MIRERLRRFRTGVGELSPKAVALWCLAFTAAVELFTCLLRFGLGLESQRDAAWMAPLTFGYRVHHGYCGVLLAVVAAFVWKRRAARNALLVVGGALLLSDMLHHFLVLRLVTGSPEFYLRY
jgi:hypothetical protein